MKLYEGEVEGGVREGYGREIDLMNKTCYEGEWHRNRKHGKGTLTTSNGKVTKGKFNFDKFIW